MPGPLDVVAEARSWLGTPFHHRAAVKGGGVDCAQLILESFVGTGVVDRGDPGYYTHDWHFHRDEERYLEFVERYLKRIDADQEEKKLRHRGDISYNPADVLVFRVGRTFSHGALVTQWPNILHAYWASQTVEEINIIGTPLADKPMRVYSFWSPGS